MVIGDRYLSIRGMATVVFGVFRYKVIVTLTQLTFVFFLLRHPGQNVA